MVPKILSAEILSDKVFPWAGKPSYRSDQIGPSQYLFRKTGHVPTMDIYRSPVDLEGLIMELNKSRMDLNMPCIFTIFISGHSSIIGSWTYLKNLTGHDTSLL